MKRLRKTKKHTYKIILIKNRSSQKNRNKKTINISDIQNSLKQTGKQIYGYNNEKHQSKKKKSKQNESLNSNWLDEIFSSEKKQLKRKSL